MAVDQLSNTFGALADPTRRAILGRLADGEATVNELAEPFPISVQAVSKHLKVLEQAGLITRSRTAQLRPSRLQGAPLADAVSWLEKYRRFWEGSFDSLDARLQNREEPRAWLSHHPGRRGRAGLTITRVFDAPRERVWKEWTEPERFADWYGGSDAEVPVATVSMDVREGAPGGRRCSSGPTAARSSGMASTSRWSSPSGSCSPFPIEPGEDAYELVTVVLTDLGDGRTEMLFQQRGRMSPEQYGRAGQGWSGFFDRMAERPGRVSRRTRSIPSRC